jgi:hypothetical protein
MKLSVGQSALRHLLRATEENMKNLRTIQSNWKPDVSRMYLFVNVKCESVVIDFGSPCSLADGFRRKLLSW